ncbi:hypothetical protein HDU79_005966 [Rhizoclosmatium sp. JEL0117]|nr:hypothetical protein HDU79_005966 [Rhizoclosmatium sp. JEL0117]
MDFETPFLNPPPIDSFTAEPRARHPNSPGPQHRSRATSTAALQINQQPNFGLMRKRHASTESNGSSTYNYDGKRARNTSHSPYSSPLAARKTNLLKRTRSKTSEIDIERALLDLSLTERSHGTSSPAPKRTSWTVQNPLIFAKDGNFDGRFNFNFNVIIATPDPEPAEENVEYTSHKALIQEALRRLEGMD